MTPSGYERRKHALDEQLRLGIELLQPAIRSGRPNPRSLRDTTTS